MATTVDVSWVTLFEPLEKCLQVFSSCWLPFAQLQHHTATGSPVVRCLLTIKHYVRYLRKKT